MKGKMEAAVWIARGREFLAEGIASAKALRQEKA